MNDELEMDASGCWVRKNAQVIIKTPLLLHREHPSRLAYSVIAKDTADNDEQDEAGIIC